MMRSTKNHEKNGTEHVYNFMGYFRTFIKNNNPVTRIKNHVYIKNFMDEQPTALNILEGDYDIDIYIVAFNKPELIEAQILFLNMNLTDKYRLIIIDNSNDEEKSLKIGAICKKHSISYVKLPQNKLKYSHSHGLSLNYIMKYMVTSSNTKYIGFLDHDCFLIKKVSIVNYLNKQPLRGLLIDNTPVKIFNNYYNFAGNRRFLWPGCSFFAKELFNSGYDFLPNKKIFPISFLDTGGGNWKYVYKHYSKGDFELLRRAFDKNIEGVENIGDIFIHLGGAGYKDSLKINESFKSLISHYNID